jgi:hypothetical protein
MYLEKVLCQKFCETVIEGDNVQLFWSVTFLLAALLHRNKHESLHIFDTKVQILQKSV